MTRYAAFLRGINLVKVNRVAMADLRTILDGLGYSDVATHLQSGNAVFTASAKPAQIERAIEGALRAELGLEIPCVIRDAQSLRVVVDADPLGSVATNPSRYFVVFLSGPIDKAVVAGIDPSDHLPAEFRVLKREVYLWLPNGAQRSKLAGAFTDKRLKVVTTMRNWNTVTKVLAMAEV